MRIYRLKYRLYIKHSMDGLIEHAHSHVIEIEFHIRPDSSNDEFVEFATMEKLMQGSLDEYQHKYINDFAIFEGNVTIEGIAEAFYKKLRPMSEEINWIIERLSVSETPLRTYSIVAKEI